MTSREPGFPRRKCPHGVQVGPLDDYGLPLEQDQVDYSSYCWICNEKDGPTAEFPEPPRPLALTERILWRLARRVPRP